MKKKFNIITFCFAVITAFILAVTPASAIKIGLYSGIDEFMFGTSKNGVIVDAASGKTITCVGPMKAYKIIHGDNSLVINLNGKNYTLNSNNVVIKTNDKDGLVYAKKHWYRGHFAVKNYSSGITLINDVDLESYIQGVVPSEMPARWNTEALKAQAIAARSYAVANMGKRARLGFDLKDNTEDQVYNGASVETIKTNDVVKQTRGQVLVCGNKVIPAYYHASSGGQTLPSSAVWGRNLPFIKPVASFDGDIPKSGHGIGMSQHGANVLANSGYNAYQILGYFYQNVSLYYLNY